MSVTIHQDGDKYIVCGTDRKGKRFSQVHSNPWVALAINMWNGRVWQVRNGRRKLIKRVTN